jgi:hypothetical protein
MSSSWPSTVDSIRDDGNRDCDPLGVLREPVGPDDAIKQDMNASVEQRVLGFLQRVGAMPRPGATPGDLHSCEHRELYLSDPDTVLFASKSRHKKGLQ